MEQGIFQIIVGLYLVWEVAERIFHWQFFHAATLITLLPIKFKLLRWDETCICCPHTSPAWSCDSDWQKIQHESNALHNHPPTCACTRCTSNS
jgi:hypothetical protein